MEMETHALVCILMVLLMVVMMFIVVVMTKRWDRDSNLQLCPNVFTSCNSQGMIVIVHLLRLDSMAVFS